MTDTFVNVVGVSVLVGRHVHESETCSARQLQPRNGLSSPALRRSQRAAPVSRL